MIQIGPNWDLSEALNNRYRLPAPPASSAPGHFGVLLIKIHLLAFVVVAIKWIIRPKTKKNLFSWSLHLNPARNSSAPRSFWKPPLAYLTSLSPNWPFLLGIWWISISGVGWTKEFASCKSTMRDGEKKQKQNFVVHIFVRRWRTESLRNTSFLAA